MDNNKLLTTLEGVGSLQLSKDFSTQFRMGSPFLQQKEKYICSIKLLMCKGIKDKLCLLIKILITYSKFYIEAQLVSFKTYF